VCCFCYCLSFHCCCCASAGKVLTFGSKVGQMFKFNGGAHAATMLCWPIMDTVRMRDILDSFHKIFQPKNLQSLNQTFRSREGQKLGEGVSESPFRSALQLLGQRLFVYLFVCCYLRLTVLVVAGVSLTNPVFGPPFPGHTQCLLDLFVHFPHRPSTAPKNVPNFTADHWTLSFFYLFGPG